jgi:hypothetical protein
MENAHPVQIVSVLITPKIVGDQTVKEALDRLAVEDPTIRIVNFDPGTGRVVLGAVGGAIIPNRSPTSSIPTTAIAPRSSARLESRLLPVEPPRIALPEPEDDDPGNGEWPPSLG